MMTQKGRFAAVLALLSGTGGLAVEARADFGTYIAVGDSLAFGVGFDDSTGDTSNGDRGYVKGLADTIKFRNGGVRPTVFDYGISGETSASYFPLNLGNGVQGNTAAARNSNYASGVQTVAQRTQVLNRISSEHGLGHQVSLITVNLGSNDLNLILLNPALTLAQKQAAVGPALAAFAQNEGTLLQELKIAAPEAKILVLDYYDPFAPFRNLPDNPATDQLRATALLAQPALVALDQTIGSVAQSLGVKFVDVMPSFIGNELALTFIGTVFSDGVVRVHPNQAGYDVITTQLGVAVPEPSSFILLGLGVAGLAGLGRRSLAIRTIG